MTDESTPGAGPSPDDRFPGEETAHANESASASATGKRASKDLDPPTLVGGVLALAVSGYLLLAEHDLGSLWVLPPLIVGGGIVMLILAVLPRRN